MNLPQAGLVLFPLKTLVCSLHGGHSTDAHQLAHTARTAQTVQASNCARKPHRILRTHATWESCIFSFGMEHDTEKNGCEAPRGTLQHVMSPQLSADSTPLVWSNCSRGAITRFLECVQSQAFLNQTKAQLNRNCSVVWNFIPGQRMR